MVYCGKEVGWQPPVRYLIRAAGCQVSRHMSNTFRVIFQASQNGMWLGIYAFELVNLIVLIMSLKILVLILKFIRRL